MRLLIIGGTKSIGPHVVRQLLSVGNEVAVYHRGENESPLPAAVRHFHSPLAAMPVLHFPKAVVDYEPDVLIHMIPMGEADAKAAVEAFRGVARRIIAVSSCDVYRAYGRFLGIESGDTEPAPVNEDSPVRTVLFPYRRVETPREALEYSYEKIVMEQTVLSDDRIPGTVLRLAKVYGPSNNGACGTMYGFRNYPNWRWTHSYVENVAAAIVLAASDSRANGRIYNVGEEHTPTVAERLSQLPPSDAPALHDLPYNFEQHLVFDSGRIRHELGYSELVDCQEGIRRTFTTT
ncbi:MAG: NAD-dependent epimerase/dehydratase family protein [Pirellulales bacterium]